jgi:Mn2+/Fe2+ NRAMP family transporter
MSFRLFAMKAGGFFMGDKKSGVFSRVVGAIFLMALSAIGPGFLTQTANFTDQFKTAFAFAILASIIIDIGAQLNVWRVITVAKKRGHEIANQVLPGLGGFLTVLIMFGGLAFQIGNVAGAGLGLNVIFGIDVKLGVIISAALAIVVFLVKDASMAMGKACQYLGILMILLTIYVMFKSSPPVGAALVQSIVPEGAPASYWTLMFPMMTLIGGTVGGYITFAGAHRLVDDGISGMENLDRITKASVSGIAITGVMRIILFLAALGVVMAGHKLVAANNPANNPAAEVFRIAAGNIGYKFFGVVFWAAAITSVIGCAYTSISFLRGYSKAVDAYQTQIIIGFILFATLVFFLLGQAPRVVLVAAGSLNGLILPVSLGILLLASQKKKIMGANYTHPIGYTIFGLIALAITIFAAIRGLPALINLITG